MNLPDIFCGKIFCFSVVVLFRFSEPKNMQKCIYTFIMCCVIYVVPVNIVSD